MLTRRQSISAMALAACGGALGGWTTALAAAGGQTKIRLGTLVPKGSSSFKRLQAMGEQWRQASGGNVQLTIYPDGTMGGEADMVRRMRVGQLQAGLITTVGLAEIEPAVTGLQSAPMIYRSLEEVDYISEKLRPKLEKRIADKGFIVLFWTDAGWVRIFSKQPVMHPDDLKKTKLFVWSGSARSVDVYKSAGFNVVPLETADILPSLQTGLISAVPTVPFYALASQIDGPAPNMLEINWAPLAGAAVIAKKTWDAIPRATQEAMMKSAAEIGKVLTQDNRKESNDSVEAMKKRGLKVHSMTPELENEWRQVVEKTYPQIRGSLVPAEIFDEVTSLLKEYRAQGGAKQ
ncbi:MAG TPA: TRAP transporter substrate-binding protein DctP [Bacillota bacterium]|nr:TRAP transporter substrate-binding protein DctP [Bacillota bacterium]